METLNIDLWPANLRVAPMSLADWLAAIEARCADAAARGVKILVMPEYCCAQWLSFAPLDCAETEHLSYLASLVPDALAGIGRLAAHYDIAILPGTMPVQVSDAGGLPVFVNRAFFLTPEGAVHYQDKLSLTPAETDGSSGLSVPAGVLRLVSWRGLRIAMAICLDSEFTDIWPLIGKANVDLVLIPAKTEMITGFHRVFGCARARAIELQSVVCVVGAVGAPLTPLDHDKGVGGAAVYLPCDQSVSLDGIWAAIGPQTAASAADLALQAIAVPVGVVRGLRQNRAEAECRPASWSAEHIVVEEPAPELPLPA